jgi:hypothetical protein
MPDYSFFCTVRRVILCCAFVVWGFSGVTEICVAQGKQLSLALGYGLWGAKDENLSQLTYTGGVAQGQLQYSILEEESRQFIRIEATNGGLRSVANRASVLQAGIEYGYTHRINTDVPTQFRFYVGGSVGANLGLFETYTSYHFADPRGFTVSINANELSGYGLVALRVLGFASYTIDERSSFVGVLSVPLLGYIIRTGYASTNPKGRAIQTPWEALGTGDIATVNLLQDIRCTVEYERRLGQQFVLGAAYRFGIFRYALPRPVGMFSNDVLVRIALVL